MLTAANCQQFERDFDHYGKDIRTVASGVIGVGDSAEVYEVMISILKYR